MDLNTGGRFARLLDPNEQEKPSSVAVTLVEEEEEESKAPPLPAVETPVIDKRKTMESVLMGLPEEEKKIMGVDLSKVGR